MLPLTIPPLPEEWEFVLSYLSVHFPNVVLAGGALRDLIHGKTVKDLDFFTNPQSENDDAYLVKNFDPWERVDEYIDEYSAAHEIQSIYTFEVQKIPCELVICTKPRIVTPKDIVDTFDIGLCQAGMNARQEFYASPAFYDDHCRQRLTVVNTSTPTSTLNRLARIGSKYPEYEQDASLILLQLEAGTSS